MASNTALSPDVVDTSSKMGLRVSDTVSPSQKLNQGLNSLSSSVCLLNTPMNNDKHFDQDETSSGYSSRDSHNGLEQAQSRRPQRSSRISILPKEVRKISNLESDDINTPECLSDNQCNKPSINRSFPNKSERKSLFRQTRIDSDEISSKSCKKSLETAATSSERDEREFIDIEVQTDPYESGVLQALKKSNTILKNKLNLTNCHFEGLVDQLENQLLTAMTEIARLKAQLVTVKNKKLKTAPCVKCGYFSDSDKERQELSSASIRKTRSMDCISQCSNTPSSNSNSNTVQLILKGQDPKEMKLALLQRNKTLRDEIQNLKTAQPLPRASSTSSLISAKLPHTPTSTRSSVNYDKYDLDMDQIVKNEPEVLARQKTSKIAVTEDVRWKQQHARSSKKQSKHPAVRAQSTSRAFRTINVKTWAS